MVRIGWMAAAALGALSLAACGKKTAETSPAPAAGQTRAQAAATRPSAPTAPAAAARPKRKAGLWEQTVEFGKMSQTSRICLDEATDEKMGLEGRPGSNPCSENKVTGRPGGGFEFASVCDLGEGGKVASHGVASGDFGSAYKVEVESTTTGAAAAQMNGVRKFSVVARWRGPCPAGMAPGEIELPGGMRINPAGVAKAR